MQMSKRPRLIQKSEPNSYIMTCMRKIYKGNFVDCYHGNCTNTKRLKKQLMSESCYNNNKKCEIIKFNAAYFLENPNCNLYVSKDLSHHEKIKLIRLLFLTSLLSISHYSFKFSIDFFCSSIISNLYFCTILACSFEMSSALSRV